MSKPHVHAAHIKAWADGAEIQYLTLSGRWRDVPKESTPGWYVDQHYRVKPEPKPDVVVTRTVGAHGVIYGGDTGKRPNLRLTLDGETGKLKKAEVI